MTCVPFVLICVIVGAIAIPVSSEIKENKSPLLDGSDSIEPNVSEIKQDEVVLNNVKLNELDQNEFTSQSISELIPEVTNGDDAVVEMVIQENLVNPLEDFVPESSLQGDSEAFQGLSAGGYFDDLSTKKIQDEIMQTAAGFAPLPFLRRRQKPRKHFAMRRNFKKNPHRRVHFFYPYYYSFYRPSSLRFY